MLQQSLRLLIAVCCFSFFFHTGSIWTDILPFDCVFFSFAFLFFLELHFPLPFLFLSLRLVFIVGMECVFRDEHVPGLRVPDRVSAEVGGYDHHVRRADLHDGRMLRPFLFHPFFLLLPVFSCQKQKIAPNGCASKAKAKANGRRYFEAFAV